MFEKDAYEYREKGKNEGYYLVTQDMEQEGLDYIIDESFKDGAEFGYNKANEWHYVKDCLPPKKKLDVGTKSEPVYVATRGYGEYKGYYNFSRKVWYLADNDYQEINEVYAWCKLPAPPRESE